MAAAAAQSVAYGAWRSISKTCSISMVKKKNMLCDMAMAANQRRSSSGGGETSIS